MQGQNLSQEVVDLWAVALDIADFSVNELRQLLTADELAKSERFYFKRDRKRYIVCRGALRQLISKYLDKSPQEIVFSYGKYGKPYLSLTGGYSHELYFNVSHSGDLAVMTFAKDQEVGVDLEQIHGNIDPVSSAESFFSNYEVAQLKMLPQHLQKEAFFACWTRKEAFLKARGDGLYFPLKDFDVSVDPREQPRLLAVHCAPEEVSQWHMYQIVPCPKYISTLVVEGGSDMEVVVRYNPCPVTIVYNIS